MKPHKKAVWGWAMYDWANSAFATTVMSGFFPVFFKQYWSAGVDVNLSTARLGLGNAAAGLLVALAAPILGAVADRCSARKRFLALFAYLGVLTTAALYFVGKGQWAFALVVYALGMIGFSGANIFTMPCCRRWPARRTWTSSRVSDFPWATWAVGCSFW
jgi:UMF1 family MFS transporter